MVEPVRAQESCCRSREQKPFLKERATDSFFCPMSSYPEDQFEHYRREDCRDPIGRLDKLIKKLKLNFGKGLGVICCPWKDGWKKTPLISNLRKIKNMQDTQRWISNT